MYSSHFPAFWYKLSFHNHPRKEEMLVSLLQDSSSFVCMCKTFHFHPVFRTEHACKRQLVVCVLIVCLEKVGFLQICNYIFDCHLWRSEGALLMSLLLRSVLQEPRIRWVSGSLSCSSNSFAGSSPTHHTGVTGNHSLIICSFPLLFPYLLSCYFLSVLHCHIL